MAARNRTLIFVELLFALVALVCGTIAFSSLVRYAVLTIRMGAAAPWTWTWALAMGILLAVTIAAYRKIDHAPLRILVVILLFVPELVSLLLDQTIPFPDVGFLNR